MSSYELKSTLPMVLSTATGPMTLNPAGDLSLKGYVKGTDVAEHHQYLADLAASSPQNGHVLSYDGSNWVAAPNPDATTAAAPLTKSGEEMQLQYNSAHLAVNGSSELELAADCIDGSRLADDAVAGEHIADDAVAAAHIADGAVGEAALASDAVSADKIADDAVTSAKIAANPQLQGPSFTEEAKQEADHSWGWAVQKCNSLTTSNNTAADAGAYTLADDSSVMVEVYAVARNQSSGDAAAYKASFAASKAGANNAALHGSGNVEEVHSDDANYAFAVAATSDGFKYQCTGHASEDVKWSVYSRIVRVQNS